MIYMADITTELAKNLVRIRNERDWTLAELEEKSNVTSAYINRLEHDKAKNVSLRKVSALAAALEVPVSALIGETPKTVQVNTHDLLRLMNESNVDKDLLLRQKQQQLSSKFGKSAKKKTA